MANEYFHWDIVTIRYGQMATTIDGCYLGVTNSNLRLLRHLQGIINLDTEVTHRAFQLGVPQQQLHRTQILCLPVNQRGLGTALAP